MQHLLSDSESSSVATGEGRHGTSAISFLGALRIPVSACAAPLESEVLPIIRISMKFWVGQCGGV